MRVVVTGSEGFIGSAVCRRLTEHGHEVVRVDAMLDGRSVPPGVHQLDVRDALEWNDVLSGADAVCHHAAKVGAAVTPADAPQYAAHNVVGTAALLAAMDAVGVRRLALASSMVVYGEGRYACSTHGLQDPPPRTNEDLAAGQFENRCGSCGTPLDWRLVPEHAPLSPRGAYAASKAAQEHFAQSWAQLSGGSVVALRYHNAYGPHMPRDTPYSGVAAMFRSSLEHGEPPQVFEDGKQLRDFVHVDDIARANVAALELVAAAPSGSFAAYNICSGQPVTIADVARSIAGALGAIEPVITGRSRASDVRHIVADPSRARAELGFSARVSPADGLRRLATDPLREPVTTSS